MLYENKFESNKRNELSKEDSEATLLDSGLYCDFGPRPNRRTDETTTSTIDGSAHPEPEQIRLPYAREGSWGDNIGMAFRRGTSNILKLLKGEMVVQADEANGSGSGRSDNVRRSRPREVTASSASVTESLEMESTDGSAMSMPATGKAKTVKPRRRRGSQLMMGGGQSSQTAARGQQPSPSPQYVSPAGASSTTASTATSSLTGSTTKAKPRRRRGSHFMPEGGTGPAVSVNSASTSYQQQGNVTPPQGETSPPAKAVTNSTSGNTNNNNNTMRIKSTNKPTRRRRGSDMMPHAGENNTSPIISPAPKDESNLPGKQQQRPETKSLSRGTSDTMPQGQMQKLTVTPQQQQQYQQFQQQLQQQYQQEQQYQQQGYMPQNNPTRQPVDYGYGATTTAEDPPPSYKPAGHVRARRRGSIVKTMVESGPKNVDGDSHSSHSQISHHSNHNSGHSHHSSHSHSSHNQGQRIAYNEGTAVVVPMEPLANANEAPPPRQRARRRGSVVKTLVESGPKNVDGDGEYVARASAAASSDYGITNDYANNNNNNNGGGDDSFRESDYGGNSAATSSYDNHHLPQRRSSQESENDGGGDHKRPMLKQQRSISDIGASDRDGLKRGARKKRDIGRKAIRPMAADLDYVHKVVQKSDDAKEMIFDAIKPNILFRACSPEELVDLVDAFEPQYVPKGSVVIKEGDEGEHFYVMERGGVDVFERDVRKCSLYSGVAFGEIALLYSCPRTATVLAKYDCKLWAIGRRAFRGITAQHKKRRLELKVEFLRKVKIHDKLLGEILQPSEINSVALATKVEEFKAGSPIVRQGERGDAFYMIEEGSVDVYIQGKGDRPIVTLGKGAFFGEKALLSSDVRTATCVASSNVKCMLLMREDFVLMLGNLQDLLDRSYISRDESKQESMPQRELYPKTQRFAIEDFDIKRTLGVGAFGFVKLVQWKAGGDADSYYALKCVSKQKIIELKQQEKIKREEDIMKSLNHPFIARCYNVMEDERGKYFLMEALCGGELCELLYHETQFSEAWSRFYSASVLAAFAHMHERKIAYRDLKPENLVLDSAGYVKIVDFGLAKVIDEGQTYTFCGTPDYLAPEVILNEGYDWAVDYWGLGVLVYEMTAGVAPFFAENPMETYEKVLSGHVHIPAHFSHAAANLIKKLLHTSQSKRMGRTVGGAKTVMRHPWFSGFDWDALMAYRLHVPHVPEIKHPDDASSSVEEEEVEGFATDFF